jgi:fatty acid omega-hydroxylase
MAEETPWEQALKYENRANPYPFFAQLRKTPIARQPDGTYVVSTYREIVSLLNDPRVSSDSARRGAAAAAMGGASTALSLSMLTMDPPDHDRVRRAVMRHFGPPHTPDLVANLEPEIERIVAGLIDNFSGKTQIDVVEQFALPLPVGIICEVLGFPTDDGPRFHTWIEAALNTGELLDASPPEERGPLETQFAEDLKPLLAYMADKIKGYAQQPGPGLLSAVVNDPSDDRLKDNEIVSTALLLLFAGHETTVNLISHSILTLLRYPAVLEKLRRRPELIVPGVEEFLRFESSVQYFTSRTALADIEIAGTTIPKGAPIDVVYASANRDPNRFANPDEVDLEREDNEHLGWSGGIHVCFGGPMARLEVQVAVGEFVRRVVNPRLAADPPPYRRNSIFRGPTHILVDIDGVQD